MNTIDAAEIIAQKDKEIQALKKQIEDRKAPAKKQMIFSMVESTEPCNIEESRLQEELDIKSLV